MRSQGCQLGYSGTRVQRRASDGPARRHDRNRLVIGNSWAMAIGLI